MGNLIRVSLARPGKEADVLVELSAPFFVGLPRDAVAPPPQGQLGLGGAYRAANGEQDGSLLLKQAAVTWKLFRRTGTSLRLGRFEFIEGAESLTGDATLDWLKRERIAHRLIGNFGFSHVQRSADGLHLVHNTPRLNATLVAARPTAGVFDLDGNDGIKDVEFLYAGLTRKGAPGRFDGRLFYLYYADDREVLKTDNRPLAARQADRDPIRVSTAGGHYARRAGRVDVLVWGAWQWGDWGALDHEAWAGDAEVGYQFSAKRWQPWIRVGTGRSSGDRRPGDGKHESFFQVLPTPRIYARFPFYNRMNLKDDYVMLLVRPAPRTTIRADYHHLRLAEAADLWYAGGGAFQRESFGYGGRPSGGSRRLANVIDLSVEHQWTPVTSLALYLAHATGGRTVSAIYPGARRASLGYLEVIRRF
jgi:hypothetical protein